MICTTAWYPDHENARDAQKRLARSYHIETNLRHCEACDGFHLIADTKRLRLQKKALEILKLMGQGFTIREIAKELEIHEDAVEWYQKGLRRKFYAMNSLHMVCIAIAFGALSPNDFVPPLLERPRNELVRSNGLGENSVSGETGRSLSDGVRRRTRSAQSRTSARAAEV